MLKGFPNLLIKVDCCLSDDSFWMISPVLFALVCVPVDPLPFAQCNTTDLPCFKILCSMYLNLPLPVGMCLKVSSEGRHIFDRLYYPTAFKRSGCDVRELGLIAQHPCLAAILIFGVLEGPAHDTTSERRILDEMLEGTCRRLPQLQ